MMFSPTSKRFSRFLAAGVLLAGWRLGYAQAGGANSIPSVGSSWPTYNGDMSGRRYSTLDQINRDNVRSLTLAWAYQTHGPSLKGTPIEVDGILYLTAPDHVWALDAQTGEQVWAFSRPSEGNHIGQRGAAYYQGRIYFGTPDAHLICLDANDGKKLWDVVLADEKFGYYLSVAPLILNGRVIVGTSGDQTNVPHFLEARDWQTGALLWRTSSLPAAGTPAAATWPNPQEMSRGGGPMWLTGTYDPALDLLYWGTGNPHPVLDGKVREGDNLYTCSILAVHPDTGAIAWYFQPSPHDTHDWDAVETPVLFDAEFHGKPRKLLAQASRNGYFFVLDRQTGENLLTTQFVKTNWAARLDAKGQPVSDPMKEPQPDGALVQGAANGGTNWMPPSFSPQTGMFYVNAQEGFAFWYLVVDQNGAPEDHQGGGTIQVLTKSVLLALDYQTGSVRWRREIGTGRGSPGVLSTSGHLVFAGDLGGNLLALDAEDGKALWHTRGGGTMDNGPMTYELHGRQYVVTAVNDMLYAWALPHD